MNCNNVMFAGIIFSTDYSVYDAIVIVGGDGSYRDAITAIYEKMHNQVQSPKQPHPALCVFSNIPVSEEPGKWFRAIFAEKYNLAAVQFFINEPFKPIKEMKQFSGHV